MFWLLHPGAVIGTETNVLVSTSAEDWRAKKGQFDVMTVRTWPHPESSNRAKLTREYVLNECWQIFVNDRPVRREAMHTPSNAL